MAIQVKKSGAYATPVGVYVKVAGAYVAAKAVFVKVGGAYVSALGAVVTPPQPSAASTKFNAASNSQYIGAF